MLHVVVLRQWEIRQPELVANDVWVKRIKAVGCELKLSESIPILVCLGWRFDLLLRRLSQFIFYALVEAGFWRGYGIGAIGAILALIW